jgi:hypothetical protein
MSLVADLLLARKLRRAGIVYPLITIQEARRTKCPLAVLCAVLEQETSGGINEFGHDPTIFPGYGEVTRAKYLAYRNRRGPKGRGGMQGVGPMQLTWYSYQDEADKLGGCWRPRYNIRVGAGLLAGAIRRSGLHNALHAYNGSEAYAREVEGRILDWKRVAA